MSPPPPRIACISLPHVPVSLVERDEPELAGRPVVVAAGDTVHDVSYVAHLAGLAPGMALAQARQVCPALLLRPARPEAEREAFQQFLAALAHFTEAVEP